MTPLTQRPVGPRRIVLTGSESVGKTTLATQLAQHFGVLCVPEFARGYALQKRAPLTSTDVDIVARGQMALEEEALAQAREAGHTLLIHDTDLLSTVVYSHHYYGRCSQFVEETALARRPDQYLLLNIDVPWMPDAVRDLGHSREAVHALFTSALARTAVPVTFIRGTWTERFAHAVHAVEALLRGSP